MGVLAPSVFSRLDAIVDALFRHRMGEHLTSVGMLTVHRFEGWPVPRTAGSGPFTRSVRLLFC